MIPGLEDEDLKDIRRGLIIAMQALDATGNPPDKQLSDRLEVIEQRLRLMTE